jgi:RNA recognition motif-containing protein
MTRLYVGNLSFHTTEAALQEAFVACVLDRETGRSRGFAFVTMSNNEGARAAMSRLDGHMLDGRALRVNEANEREPRGGGGAGRPRW